MIKIQEMDWAWNEAPWPQSMFGKYNANGSYFYGCAYKAYNCQYNFCISQFNPFSEHKGKVTYVVCYNFVDTSVTVVNLEKFARGVVKKLPPTVANIDTETEPEIVDGMMS